MYYMPPSPKGRTIMRVEGNASEITTRGWEIEYLGGVMRSSAETLKDISTRTGEQEGKAVTDLADTIGDSYKTLFQAADLYEPVGPVIRKYGQALEDVQPSLDSHAENCQELWSTYVSLPGSVDPRGTGGLFEPDEGSPEAEEQAEEDAAKKAAYEDWETEAQLFDGDYDTWESAFDTAVDGITDGTSDAIEDGFWRTALDVFNDVLGWAGLILGVAAMFFPPLALAAAIVGAISLAATIGQMIIGDADGVDVAFAALGVIPVGKLGKLGQVDGFSRFADDVAKQFKPSTYREMTESTADVFRNRGFREGMRKFGLGNTSQESMALRGEYAPYGMADFGPFGTASPTQLANFDRSATALQTLVGHDGSLGTLGIGGYHAPDLVRDVTDSGVPNYGPRDVRPSVAR